MPSKLPIILFVDNGTNYILFLEVARTLREKNAARIVFVTLIEARVDLFQKNGVDAVYLDLSRSASGADLSKAHQLVSALEAAHSTFRLELGIKRDRILRFMPNSRARRILLAAAGRFSELLDLYEPVLVLGEVSWAIEYLFYYISLDSGIRYRHILNVPGDNLRITAFDDRHTHASAIEASSAVVTDSLKVTKSYVELCDEVKSYRISLHYFLRHFRFNYSLNDYREALFYRVRRVLFPAYKVLSRLFYLTFSEEKPEQSASNILLILHIQPESTPDFVSPFHADQVKLAKDLTEALRSDQTLYIKDHPNTISVRNLVAWANVLRHPQVRLLPREISAKTLYDQFECVVSIAGTGLLECSEVGVPALCFSDVYLKGLPGVFDGRDFPNLADAISTASAYTAPQGGNVEEVRRRIGKIGFPGFIHDARVSPQVLAPDNVARLAQMIIHMLKVAGDGSAASVVPRRCSGSEK